MGEKKRKKQAQGVAGSGGGTGPSPSEIPESVTEVVTHSGASAEPTKEPELPPLSSAPLPLMELEASWLGGFLELCFADRRLIALCRELKIHPPGYRLEALPPEQVARMLADEYLAAEDVRAPLETAIRETLHQPMFEGRTVGKEQLGALLDDVLDAMVTGDPMQHLARIAWAALLEKELAGHAALSAIDEGLLALEGPVRPGKEKETREEKLARLEMEQAGSAAEELVKRAERAERERDSLQKQLSAQRNEMVSREESLAETRVELNRLRQAHGPLQAQLAKLTAAGDGRALADLRRAEAELRGAAERSARLEEAKRQAEDRALLLEKQLAGAAMAVPPAAHPVAEDLPTEEDAQTFLLPVFTREFYDSIERWSRRMQRAAFDKIHRLAGDWRHGSLRALALEGLPGYYRIRVATDVRLIYRREGNQLEILSLIDREDLDRYIRQARTR